MDMTTNNAFCVNIWFERFVPTTTTFPLLVLPLGMLYQWTWVCWLVATFGWFGFPRALCPISRFCRFALSREPVDRRTIPPSGARFPPFINVTYHFLLHAFAARHALP